MKRFLFPLYFCALLLTFPALSAQKSLNVNGKINNNTFDKVYLKLAYNNNQAPIASVPVKEDGTFSILAQIPKTDLYRLSFTEKESLLGAFSPGEKIYIEFNGEDLSLIDSVAGSSSMELVKQAADLITQNKNLLSHINQSLQTNQTQIFYNNFHKEFSPYQQSNKDIDNYIITSLATTAELKDMVSRYSKNGQINSKKVDSFLLLTPEMLKTIENSYRTYESYKESVLPNYNITSNTADGDQAFHSKVNRYNALLEERHRIADQDMVDFMEGVRIINLKRDSLAYNGLLENKKNKTALANEIIALVDKHAGQMEKTEKEYSGKAVESENISKEILAESQNKVTGVVAQHQAQYDQQNKIINERIKSLLLENKDELAVLMFVDYFPRDNNVELHNEIVTALHKKYPDNQIVNDRYKVMQSPSTSTSIGATAPELAFPNPDGTIMKLSDLRGKVVLIDFWASWCGPCRRENPNVVNVYNKYKDKGFEIYSVSLDRDKNSWIKAIETDKLVWKNHVSDLKYWSSEAAKLYGVNSIPATFLIDKDGKIIGKNLRGEQLSNALKNIFGE